MYISRCFCFIHNFSFLCLLPAHSGVYSGGDRTAAAAWNSRGYKIHELWHAEVYVVWIIKTNYLSDSIILEHVSDAGVPSSAGVCNTANVSALIYSSRLHVMTVLWLEIRACRVFLYLYTYHFHSWISILCYVSFLKRTWKNWEGKLMMPSREMLGMLGC